jgi:hypothetical protein
LGQKNGKFFKIEGKRGFETTEYTEYTEEKGPVLKSFIE